MKKTVLFGMLLATMVLSAQNAVMTKGDKVATLGLGFGGAGASDVVTFTSPAILIEAAYDQGISDKIWYGYFSAGAYLGRAANSETVSIPASTYGAGSSTEYKASTITVAVRGFYHWDLYELTKKDIFTKLDVYSGIQMGMAFAAIKSTTVDEGQTYEGKLNESNFRFSGVTGFRYSFNEQFAAYLEFASGKALSLGVAYKL